MSTKLYVLARKNGSFQTLPADIQTNAEAIRHVAKMLGLRLQKNQQFDEEKFEPYFKEHKGLHILCDEVSFFPRGKAITVKVPRRHQDDMRAFAEKKPDRRSQRRHRQAYSFVFGEGATA